MVSNLFRVDLGFIVGLLRVYLGLVWGAFRVGSLFFLRFVEGVVYLVVLGVHQARLKVYLGSVENLFGMDLRFTEGGVQVYYG